MTAVDDRVLTVFENLEVPEGYRAELIRGEIVMTAGPDKVHNVTVEAIRDQIPRAHWHRLQTQDLSMPGRLIPSSVATMVVEVVSRTSGDRDHRTKRQMYAEGGIPAYLIVDPVEGVCVLLAEPSDDRVLSRLPDYRAKRTSRFGDPIPVHVLGLTLETTDFQGYAD
ncbi:Uma2 family endonuclease [Kitasatospora sp. NBC_00070]|uniref:Uma2 family endonuclease n=1 Tax=Kitasatospora sp. NBC_00070 TaxID=2975962 RepID=UPI00324BAAD9